MEIRKMRETLNPITPETTPTMFFVSTAFRSSKHLKVKEYHEGDVENYIHRNWYIPVTTCDTILEEQTVA